MKPLIVGALLWVGIAGVAVAQPSPWVVPFNGVVTHGAGVRLNGPVPIMFAVYEDAVGGTPLWVEVQVVQTDAQGQYLAFLGASTDGLPTDLLAGGAARWLGAAVAGQPEQARVQLLSVPYALQAADAETLGGLPASAYLTAPDAGAGGVSSSSGGSAPAVDGDGTGDDSGTLTADSGDGLVDSSEGTVITGNQTIKNSLCVGGDCLDTEAFGVDTIKLKETRVRILFDDTTDPATQPGFPSNDWQLTANDTGDGGANKFSIDDITGGTTPFTVEAGAPEDSLFVNANGDVSLGNNNAERELHITDGEGPVIRLEQDGLFAQTWDIIAHNNGFRIADITGNTLPFTIADTAPNYSLTVAATGDVGLGTDVASEELHVRRTDADDVFVRLESTGAQNAGFQLRNSLSTYNFYDNKQGHFFIAQAGTGGGAEFEIRSGEVAGNNPKFIFSNGAGADLLRIEGDGDINSLSGVFGTISDRHAKTDITRVNARDVLDRLSAIPISTWRYKANADELHMGPMAQDFWAAYGLHEGDTSIALNDLSGVALGAIQGLNEKLAERDAVIGQLLERSEERDAMIDQLLERVAALEAARER